ncbi:MAG: response regulator [Bacteroidales bacterium]|nr:response regulator [Bacteroidales bacterium]
MGLFNRKKSSEKKFVAGREPWKFKPSLHIGVGKALLIWFLIISFIPLATVSYINYLNAFKGLTIVAEKSLVTTSNLRVEYINTFFEKVLNSLELQSNLKSNADLLEKLSAEFRNSESTLDEYVNSDGWKNLTREKHTELEKIRLTRNFYDIVFIDQRGNILFSLQHNNDLGTNIYRSKYSDSKFAQTARKILDDGETLFSDLERYAPADSTITGMFGRPITRPDGERIGMIGIQIRMDELNKIIQEDVGLGETGVAYIIGEDLLMRSSTRFRNDSVILSKRVNHDHAMNWLRYRKLGFYDSKDVSIDTTAAMEKVKSYATTDGTWVYGIYRNIDSLKGLGVNWAIIEEIDLYEAFAYTRKLLNTVIISLIITAVIVFFISIFITSRFVTPLKRLSAWAKEVSKGELIEKDVRVPKNEVGEMVDAFNNLVIRLKGVAEVSQLMAKGDFSRTVDERSKNDVMAKSMNQMIESFKSVVRQANTIAQGDYSTNVVPRSDKDTLGVALYEMTKTLRENAKEIRNRDWLKTGLGELNDRMSGKKDIETLTQEIITFLVSYTKSDLGLLYLSENESTLKLTASYAFYDRYNKFTEIHYGEGLVGQAAKQQEPIEYNKQKGEVPKLNTGVEEQTPTHFVIHPIQYEGKLIGVMQLGSTSEYSDLEKTFLENGMGNIGIAINSAQAHTRLQQLLKQTQDQKERLQVQQEELRQTNEELAEQTKALKVSEETLQNQKEELSVINEELEERTKALERERDNVNKKNRQLKQAQEEVEKKARDLEMASKYKSEFLANMSHELRTPLNSILVLSQVLIDNKENNLSEKQIEYAKTINTSGSDLLNLINEILDLSKIESGKIEIHSDIIDLSQFKKEIERSFHPIITSKGLKFDLKMKQDVPARVESDSQRMHQIIRNLLSNAVKFTEKGRITFTIFKPAKNTQFKQKALKDKNVVGFSVSDTGIGISTDKQEVIFDAFQQGDGTTNRKFGGTGLGLTISRSFAELLGGEIHLESEVGKGTTFTLFIPDKLPSAEEQEEKESTILKAQPVKTGEEKSQLEQEDKGGQKEQGDTGAETDQQEVETRKEIHDDRRNIKEGDRFVLIIENEASLIRKIYDEAKQRQFKCMIANDGETGIHYADYYKPSAIILNTDLPGISGWDVMKRLVVNPQTMHIPVYLMTNKDENLEAMKMGAVGTSVKPIDDEAINNALDKLEDIIFKSVKKILIVDDEAIIRKSVENLVAGKDVQTISVASGQEAIDALGNETIDCIILDLGLEDMSGFDVLEKVKKDNTYSDIPVIIYTGQDLTKEEEQTLQKYADSIIIKGARSPERLLAETTLFLHRVEANLPKSKQEMLHMVYDRDAIFKNKKVLVVDDDMRNVFAISSVLEPKGLTVLVGKNGREGVDKLKENPDVDLVLMDIMMPEMDGYEAMREIRKMKQYANLPIIALTAKAMREDRDKCIEAGANEYLAKPFDTDKLLSLLRVWLYK